MQTPRSESEPFNADEKPAPSFRWHWIPAYLLIVFGGILFVMSLGVPMAMTVMRSEQKIPGEVWAGAILLSLGGGSWLMSGLQMRAGVWRMALFLLVLGYALCAGGASLTDSFRH